MPTARQIAAAERRAAKERFRRARIVERQFSSVLGGVGRHIGNIVQGFIHNGRVRDQSALRLAMDNYALVLSPWAESVCERMQAEVSTRDLTAWRRLSRAIGTNLAKEIEGAPLAPTMRVLRDEQIRLITSLPREASDRVHDLTQKALISGSRAEDLIAEIQKAGPVSVSRARLIARTEVARTASTLTQARSEHVGSTHYIWRTTEDSDVRKEHDELANTVIAWGQPPIAGTGKGGVPVRYHAGQGPNCRCWPEPIIPDL